MSTQSIIRTYPFIPFDELNWCHKHGIMYQRDMTTSIDYSNSYFEHYIRLENTNIAVQLNKGRTDITEKYCTSLLDVGIGSGEFIKSSNVRVFGFDINPVAVKWLRQEGLYVDPYANMPEVEGLTFWDVLEHIPNPNSLLDIIRPGMYAFISIPVFADLLKVRHSKHFKPNEHYYYFSAQGMVSFMDDSGFDVLEVSDFETRAGREDIATFVFRKR